jgi:CRP/FNR family cyclic AMP-dependent transcriptional regulator
MELQTEIFKQNDYIFFEGDLDYHFYIIEEGKVQIFTKTKAGKRLDISVLEAGDSFGEFAMLLKLPRSASAQALTECRLIKVTEEGFQMLLKDLPGWASSMMKGFAARLRGMNEALKDLPQFVPNDRSTKRG